MPDTPTTYTADGTPVITYTTAEWDEMRAANAARDPEEDARERAARQAKWVADRKAYEAAQAKAAEEAAAKAAAETKAPTTRVRRLGRLLANAARSVVAPATLVTDKATTTRPTTPPAPAATSPEAARLLEAAADAFTTHWPNEEARQDELITWIAKTAAAQHPRLTEEQLHTATEQAITAAPTIPPGTTRSQYARCLHAAAQQLRNGGDR